MSTTLHAAFTPAIKLQPKCRVQEGVNAPVPIPKGRNWNVTWNWRVNTPWWWADGKRDVYEIAGRSALETGRDFTEKYLEDVLAQFAFFDECGYASIPS